MLNKNDPLIGAVQEVMKKNQAEREAAKLVNEKFGVTDRKALPHERQGEWDAAYKSVLNEALHPNQQKLDVHEPEKDKLTAQDFKMLRAKKKPMEEATDGDTTSPSSMGIKKPDYASGTPDYANKGPQMVNRAAKTSLPAGTMKEEMTDAQKAKREKIVMSMKKKMAGFKDRYGERAKDVMYATATKQAMKEDNEGFNGRHGLSVTASAGKQAVAEQARARSDYGLGAIPAQKNSAQRRAELDARMEKGIDTVAPFIPGVGAARAIDKYARGQQGLGQTAADVGLNLAGGALVKGAAKGYNYLKNLGKAATKTDDAVKAAPKLLSAPKSPAVSQAAREPASSAATRTPTAVDKFIAKAKEIPVTPAAREGGTTATAAGTKAAANASKYTKPSTASGRFTDRLAQARKNAGSDPKARQLPALRRTTEPTVATRPNVPAVVNRPSTAVTRPGMPNLAAGGKTRVVGLSPKGKAAAGAVAGGAALGGYAATQMGNKPAPVAAARPEVPGKLPAASKPVTAASVSTSPDTTQKAPIPKVKPTAVSKVKPTAAPAPQAQRPAAPAAAQPSAAERRENRRQLDRGQVVGQQAIAAQQRSGTGVTTGTTIQQKAAPQVKRPVGTGREK